MGNTVDIFNDDAINSELDGVEKQLSLIQSSLVRNPESTGLLSLDLILSGGTTPGSWITFFGGEQSAKSTLAMTILNKAILSGTKRLFYNDYEGSFDDSYFEAIGKTLGSTHSIQDIFGVKDDKGKYVKTPMIRYYSSQVGEDFFDLVYKLETILPDKLHRDGKWWYVFEKKNKAKYESVMSKKLYRETGKVWVEAPDGKLQALFVVDSYPAMLPRGQDKEDPGSAIAVQARMFSTQLKRVKGRMRQKRISVIGVNQIRKVPMAMYGPSESEPCGQALSFFCVQSDTLLQTAQGLVTAEEYYFLESTVDILGSKGMETPTIYEKTGYSQLTKVTTAIGTHIEGKPGHKILTISKGGSRSSWVALSDINVDDNHYTPVKIGSRVWPTESYKFYFKPVGGNTELHTPRLLTYNNEDLSLLLGILYRDGRIQGTNNLGFVYTKEDSMEEYARTFKKVFNYDPYNPSDTRINNVHSSSIVQYLKYIGLTEEVAHKVPLCIRMGTQKQVVYFFRGLFNVVGVPSYVDPTFITMSERFVKEIQQLLFNFGIVSQVAAVTGGMIKGHTVTIINSSLKAFINMLNSYEPSFYYSSFDHKIGNGVLNHVTDTLFYVQNKVPFNLIDYLNIKGVMVEWLNDAKNGLDECDLSTFTDEWFTARRVDADSAKTTQERKSLNTQLDNLEILVRDSVDNNWFWTKITDVELCSGSGMTYDANMSETSTIVTNGIVSHNSDVRIRLTGRSIPGGKGAVEEEEGVNGGTCQYRYVHMRTKKNKLSTPFLEGWARIWIKDELGKPHGFDPVFDTFTFLKECGMVSGTRNRMKIVLPRMNGGEHKGLTWLQFKTLILGTNRQMREVFSAVGVEKPFYLRKECFKLMENGTAMELYFEALQGKEKD